MRLNPSASRSTTATTSLVAGLQVRRRGRLSWGTVKRTTSRADSENCERHPMLGLAKAIAGSTLNACRMPGGRCGRVGEGARGR